MVDTRILITKSRKMEKSVLFILAFMLPFYLAIHSCKPKTQEEAATQMAEKMMEQATGSEIDIQDGGANITIEGNGEKVRIDQQAKEWPDEIPSGIPQMPDGVITRVVRSESNETLSWSVVYEPVQIETIEAYAKELKDGGFEVMKMQMGEGGQVSGHKTDLVVLCIYSDEMCTVSVQKTK